MLTSQGVQFASTIKAVNIVAGKTYHQQGMPAKTMTVLYIAPKFRLMRGGSSISLHRPARVRLADGRIAVGRFWYNQGYFEVKEDGK